MVFEKYVSKGNEICEKQDNISNNPSFHHASKLKQDETKQNEKGQGED